MMLFIQSSCYFHPICYEGGTPSHSSEPLPSGHINAVHIKEHRFRSSMLWTHFYTVVCPFN